MTKFDRQNEKIQNSCCKKSVKCNKYKSMKDNSTEYSENINALLKEQ